jgi:hypothetical protein
MDAAPKQFAEVRLLVVATVEFSHEEFIAVVRDRASTSSSVTEIVAAELVSNLESLAYIGAVVTVEL